MLLASVKTIRGQLGFDDMTDINEAIKGALLAAAPILEAALNTPFKGGERVDVFYAREPSIAHGGHFETRLKLKMGFIREPTVLAFPSGVLFTEANQGRNVTNMLMNAETGVLSLLGENFGAQYITVAYQHGFDAETVQPPYDEDNPPDPLPPREPSGSYDLTQVPDWLQQAATLHALLALDTHPTFEQTGLQQDTSAMKAQLSTILTTHSRYEPLALLAR